MNEHRISICKNKHGFKIGCFSNGFDCVRDFIFYADEQTGIDDAKTFFKGIGVDNPSIIRPVITKMVLRS